MSKDKYNPIEESHLKERKRFDALSEEETTLTREQRALQQSVDALEYQINNFRETRLLAGPSRLPRPPLSIIRSQTLAIFGGIGVLVALATVLVLEMALRALALNGRRA